MAFGAAWMADLSSGLKAGLLFAWIFSVILWSAFGVVEEADHLAELLGEPLGTLVLTLAIVIIEVVLISAVMLGAKDTPTLGRDTMFAVLMIVLNGVVGLSLLIGGFRHTEQSYNPQGAMAYLALLVPLSVIALVIPSFTTSTTDGSLTTTQAICFSAFTLLLYGLFLVLQTGRHRAFFADPVDSVLIGGPAARAGAAETIEEEPHQLDSRVVARHTVLLVAAILPIVLLSKQLASLIDHGIAVLQAPAALGGMLIALIVFTPEGISAFRAAYQDQLQRATNLALGASGSTIGLTVPAVLMVGLLTGKTVVLGLSPSGMVLLALTLFLSLITFSGSRTTMLEGAVHLAVFFVYIVLIFSP